MLSSSVARTKSRDKPGAGIGDYYSLICNTFPMFIGLYCQTYQVGSFSWSKKDVPYNLQSCQDPRDQFVPSPTAAKYEMIGQTRRWQRRQDVVGTGNGLPLSPNEKEELEQSYRTVLMLDHTWTKVRKAFVAYHEAVC